MLYRCHADYKKWEEKAVFCAHLYESKDEVRDVINERTGLRLDYVNSADGKGTSTDGKQGRRFYSDELKTVIEELLSHPHNRKHKEAMTALHKQLSVMSRKCDNNNQIEDVYHRLLERSDPI